MGRRMKFPSEPRSDWPDWQNDLLVADYFDMFGRWKAGEHINRLERNRELQRLTGRKKGSIERKRMNVSAVLRALDMIWMKGFAPYDRFQGSLVDAVERYLDRHPEWVNDSPNADLPVDEIALTEGAPPPRGPAPKPINGAVERIARKYNRAERDYRNRALGLRGERIIFHLERRRLAEAGLGNLANRVEWTSQERGDGVGYDILSFRPDGTPRKIEVKTTTGSKTTPFFLTRTEREACDDEPEVWCLYRLHDLDRQPGLFCVSPPLDAVIHLTPETWRGSF